MKIKELFAGLLVVTAWLAVMMASGELVVEMSDRHELILRTTLGMYFGAGHFIAGTILNKK